MSKRMIVKHRWDNNNKGRKEQSEKTLPVCQFLFLDSCMGWPGIEPVPWR